MPNHTAWVTIASTYFLPEADVIRSVLAEHDIEVFLKGEHTTGLASPLALMDRGVRIQVKREDEARALEILREFEAEEQPESLVLPDGTRETSDERLDVPNTRVSWVLVTATGLVLLVLWLLSSISL